MARETLKLKANHTWRSKPGQSICVIERGLVRFEYPSHWIVDPKEGSVYLHDRRSSVESCDLGVSLFPAPPGADLREVKLEELLLASIGGGDREPYKQSEIRRWESIGMDGVWLEQRYIEAEYNRDARFRVALARGSILCLISMNYWADRASGLTSVWDEVLRTLVLDERIEDPTKGPVVQ